MPSFRTSIEWYKKAQLDYFTLFLKLWLCFNGWYSQTDQDANSDREVVNNLKESDSRLFEIFEREWFSGSNKWKSFERSITELVRLTELQPIRNNNGEVFDFDDLLLSEEKKEHLIEENEEILVWLENRDSKVEKLLEQELLVQFGKFYVESNKEEIFATTLEIIYQVRCSLMHGDMNINEMRNHEIVEHCYHFLNELLEELVV